jgi:3D (Asp-Asp-Asp) domain-containing protein
MFLQLWQKSVGKVTSCPGYVLALMLFAGAGVSLSHASSASSGPNLVTNGGFEASTSETTTPPGWTNIGHHEGVIPYSNFPQQPVYQGNNFYDLGGYGDPLGPIGDGIEQTVATVPGTAYTLTFGLSGENTGVSTETLTVTVGSHATNFPLTPTGTGLFTRPFTTETIKYSATANSTTISFVTTAATNGTGANDPLIDGVVFSATGTNTSAIAFARANLTTVLATGTPPAGTFSLSATRIAGSTNIAKASFATATTSGTNPATIDLADPVNPSTVGAPTAGGLGSFTVGYSVGANAATKSFQVPTFGMSCYSTPLESDWGSPIIPVWGGPPTACTPVTVNGKVYSSAITNPSGLAGTYCSAFIEEVITEGVGTLNNGTNVKYSPSTTQFSVVTSITGHDGTPLLPGKTVARDLRIIPDTGVKLSLHNIGNGILANDAGTAISGYRLALYKGAGKSVCNNFNNQIVIGACQPAEPNCPGSALK